MIYNDSGNGNNNEVDPITKYVKYGVFPMQLVVHVMLVVFTTFQVVLIVANDNNYSRAQERVMYNMFIDGAVDQTEVDYLKYKYLYTTNEVKEHVAQSVNNYFNVNATSFENVTYNNDNTHVVMDITYKHKTVNNSYIISSLNHYGLFGKDERYVTSLMKTISYFTLKYAFTTYIPNTSYKQCDTMCTLWEITQVYSFKNNAHCIVTLNINRLPCHVSQWYTIYMNSPLVWINIAVFFLALYSLRRVWTYISSMARIFISIKMNHNHHQPYSDNSIYYNPLTDVPNEYQTLIHPNTHRNNTSSSIQFNKWEIICLLGNIIQLFASFICIIDIHHYMTCTELSIACGCFCAYLYLGRYIDFSKQYSAINMTILKSLPNVIRYLIGAVPVFMAFLFFGLCAFWKSERFSSISNVIITLFSLANGDSIYDVLSELSGIYFVLGQLYAYLFCIFFIVVVLNVFIAIVQEGYSRSQNETKNHWVYDEDNMQELKSCLALQKVNDDVREELELKDVKGKKDEQDNNNTQNNEDDDNDNEIVRNVYNEITKIEKCLNDIEVIAKNALKRGNAKLFEELRDNIFEFINEDVNTKLHSIKDILNDK